MCYHGNMPQTSQFPSLVRIILDFNPQCQFPTPLFIFWKNEKHKIEKLGMYYKYKKGTVTIHMFEVCSKDLQFKLSLDSSNLKWFIEDIYDPYVN